MDIQERLKALWQLRSLPGLLCILKRFLTRIDTARISRYYNITKRNNKMPLKAKEMEKIILADGWVYKSQEGSHRHYIHPTKTGKVTIPFHGKDLRKGTENSILKQAGLK